MKHIKLFGLIFLALFMISFVSAVPPTATTEGWIIRSAIPNVFMKQDGVEYDFHAHVFDGTTGNPIINTCNCTLHVYDNDGTHLFEGYDDTASHDFDYSWKIGEGNFSLGVEYPYIMQCNGTYATDDEGGFYSASFKASYNGVEVSEGQSIIYIGLLIVLILVTMATFFAISLLPERNNMDGEGKIISISYMKYLRSTLWFVTWMLFIAVLFVSSNVAMAFLPGALMAGVFFKLYYICFSLTPLVVICWMIHFFVMFFHDKQFQALLNRGFFPGGQM